MTTNNPAQTFLEEASELLVQLEETLLSLEADSANRDLVDTAFRALHTIKGSGGMFGFDAVASFTHHIENAFDSVRSGQQVATPDLIALALAAKDHIRNLIESPEEALPETGKAILDKLAVLVGEGQHDAPSLPSVPSLASTASEHATYRIRFSLPRDAMWRGTNPMLLLDDICDLGSCTIVAITDDVPYLEEMDPWECYLSWDVVLSTDHQRQAIDEVFIFVIDDIKLKVDKIESEEQRLGDILVGRGDVTPETVEQVVQRQEKIGAVLLQDGKLSEGKLKAALAEQEHIRKEASSAKEVAPASIRVPAERLDGLMDRVGELVIAQARLRQLASGLGDANLKSVAEEIERLAAELRDTTMGIRMVPIGTLFGRFKRLVHDLSRDLGKEIHLSTSGEETELDKTVIERLADPLVHIIRNSIDHGIELPSNREAAGKPSGGNVHLAAHHSGAQVLITVRDDGKGLNIDRIRARAEEAGLIAPGARLANDDLFQFIFHPGFSTAQEVTNVSGRGVGMDVVKRTIEGLRGTVEVTSTSGQGAEVTLRLPLTLAIIDGLLVRIGSGRYVIPLSAVEECVELSATDDARSRGRSFLNIRGDLVPFLRLRELFNVHDKQEVIQKVVIVSSGDLRVGLVVDQVIGDHQTVIKSLSKLHEDVETFSGATIMGDGTVALILDVAHLIEFGHRQEERKQAS